MKQPINIPISKRGYELVEPYGFVAKGHYFIIAKGFKYDGASVPQWAWSISGLRPDGLIRAAATVHDYLYENNGYIKVESGEEIYFTRKEADQIFLNLMIEAGMKPWRAKLAYKAVRIGAKRRWSKREET